jgi:hypothetical protein
MGFNDRWGLDPVFGKETSGKVKRTLRDRYLMQSDRRAMEIVYLGRPLSAPQRDAAEAFYKKLSPEQKQAYSQKSQAEFDLMWGSEPPNDKVSGQMKWVLRAQQMEQDYAGQVFRGEKKAVPTAKVPGAAQDAVNQSRKASDPVTAFQQQLKSNSLQHLAQNRTRIDQSQQRYQETDPQKNPNWETLRQGSAAVATLNTHAENAKHKLLETYRTVTGDRVSSPFPLLSTVTSPEEGRQLMVGFYQKQLGPRWQEVGPQMMPWIDQFYAAESMRADLYAQEPALAVVSAGGNLQANTPENNRVST